MTANVPPSQSSIVFRRWVILFLTFSVLGLSVYYAEKASDNASAFVRWRGQLKALVHGENIYERYEYPNAPLMALMLYPFSLLPRISLFQFDIDVGALSWFYAKVGMTLLAFIWVRRLTEGTGRSFPLWAQAAALLLSIRPIVGDLMHGNINLLILFLVVASLYAFFRGQDALAGMILALAITCKLTPALFLPYFLWKRAWKTLAGCVIGLALWLIVLPTIFLGPDRNWELLTSWTNRMIVPFVVGGKVWTTHNNQSLPGLIYRLGTESPSFLDEDYKPAEFHNIVNLDPQTASRVVKGCGLAFLALLVWACRTPTQPRANWKLAAEYSVVVLGMLIFSERTWKHHCVTLLLPFAVLCYYLAGFRPRPALRGYLIASIAASVLLMSLTSTSLWEVFGYRHGSKLAQVYGAYVWAEILLLAAVVLILRRHGAKSTVQFRDNNGMGFNSLPHSEC